MKRCWFLKFRFELAVRNLKKRSSNPNCKISPSENSFSKSTRQWRRKMKMKIVTVSLEEVTWQSSCASYQTATTICARQVTNWGQLLNRNTVNWNRMWITARMKLFALLSKIRVLYFFTIQLYSKKKVNKTKDFIMIDTSPKELWTWNVKWP